MKKHRHHTAAIVHWNPHPHALRSRHQHAKLNVWLPTGFYLEAAGFANVLSALT